MWCQGINYSQEIENLVKIRVICVDNSSNKSQEFKLRKLEYEVFTGLSSISEKLTVKNVLGYINNCFLIELKSFKGSRLFIRGVIILSNA